MANTLRGFHASRRHQHVASRTPAASPDHWHPAGGVGAVSQSPEWLFHGFAVGQPRFDAVFRPVPGRYVPSTVGAGNPGSRTSPDPGRVLRAT